LGATSQHDAVVLQERNEWLFYRTVIAHVEEIMPWIYTPTVGEACREFSHIAREPKGFFITPDDRGRIAKILDNWPSGHSRHRYRRRADLGL
jgi:malate dehydrogenase (oxaloacetate-decarboxylating)(NADP+)